jgi:hypothetical protein
MYIKGKGGTSRYEDSPHKQAQPSMVSLLVELLVKQRKQTVKTEANSLGFYFPLQGIMLMQTLLVMNGKCS